MGLKGSPLFGEIINIAADEQRAGAFADAEQAKSWVAKHWPDKSL